MLCIIEGPDGAGKSTFIESLQRFIRDAEVLHFGPPQQWPVSEYELPFEAYKAGGGHTIICDRLHVGELIYGPLYRGVSQLDATGLVHVTAYLQAKGAVVAYLDEPDGVLIERVASRGDDFIKIEHLPRIAAEYRRLAVQEKLIHLTNPSRSMLVACAGAAEREAVAVSAIPSYIGSPAPETLLIGNAKSSDAGPHHSAAFVPWSGKSGEVLMQAIGLADLRRWGCFNHADTVLEDALFTLGYPKRIVALGKSASVALTGLGVTHVALPHPSMCSRWNKMSVDAYASMLKEAGS